MLVYLFAATVTDKRPIHTTLKTMALTLIEAAKLAANQGKEFEAAVALQYAESSPILENLPFRDIMGNAFTYNREETLPGIGFRGVNGSFNESTGVMNPQTETLAIAGGDLDVDTYLIKTMGGDIRATQERQKIKALSLAWTNTSINGDTQATPEEFDGLKKRLTGTQLISNAASGTGALSLDKLHETYDQVMDPTHWIMNQTMARRLTAASRNSSVGGFVTHSMDSFGRPISTYMELPILVLKQDNNRAEILPFTEAGNGSGSDGTSIYCVSFRDMGLIGLQNGGIEARDLGEIDSKPAMRTRVEWLAGQAMFDAQSAARLYAVTNGAVVA